MHLQLLFRNLIGTALNTATPNREPVVHIGVERHGETWVLSVRDNGIGIAKAFKEKILASSQRHCGRIWVESESGCGSTFYFSFAD